MKLKKVKPIEINAKGEMVFNLAADTANADWLRAARLLKQGRIKEVEKLSKTPMYYLADDDEPKDQE